MSLFSRQIPVLFYSRSKLRLGLVELGTNPSWQLVYDGKFETENLFKTIIKHRKILGFQNWHILVGDELCYVFNLNFFRDFTRDDIFKQALTEIPEIFADEDWDYKIVETEITGKQRVLVFSPVQEFWQQIKLALTQAEIEVVAVEPEAIALKRHSNPFVGLCLKSDIVGNDGSVLNIRVEKKPWYVNLFRKILSHKYRLLMLSLGIALGVFTLASGIIEIQTSH